VLAAANRLRRRTTQSPKVWKKRRDSSYHRPNLANSRVMARSELHAEFPPIQRFNEARGDSLFLSSFFTSHFPCGSASARKRLITVVRVRAMFFTSSF
jgi:hypothetical protein